MICRNAGPLGDSSRTRCAVLSSSPPAPANTPASLRRTPVAPLGVGTRGRNFAPRAPSDRQRLASFLFNYAVNLAPGLRQTRQRDGYGADGVKRGFSILPPQSMQIGSLSIQQVSFAAPADSGENALTSKEDGLLATVLFRRVFISYADRFVVLEPW
jgi:hypothetical protein